MAWNNKETNLCNHMDHSSPYSSVHGILHFRAREWISRHTWVGKMPWKRAWLPTPIVLPGESQGQRSLAGYRGCKESDTTEWLSHTHTYIHMCMHGKLLQSFLTLYDPMDYSPPGSSVHETLQVKLLGKKKKRILEWVAISFSRVSSPSKDWTRLLSLLHWKAYSLPLAPPGKPHTHTKVKVCSVVSNSWKLHGL